MLNKNDINSGDYCINLQVSGLQISPGLSKKEFIEIREEIVQRVLDQLKREQKLNKLSSSSTEDYTQNFIDTDLKTHTHIKPEELINILKNWNTSIPHVNRAIALDKLFMDGLSLILHNPKLASYIQDSLQYHPVIKNIVKPACKISLDQKLSLSDLKALIEILMSHHVTSDHYLSIQHQLYLITVLFRILYQEDLMQENNDLIEILDYIQVSNNELLWQFFADTFFRIRCGYLFANKHLIQYIEEKANAFFESHLNSPLSYLKKIILNPIEIYKSYNFDTIVADLKKIAIQCRNIIEARWVISALFRVLPLYKTEDIDLDYDNAKKRIIDGFDKTLLSKLHFLRYMELKNYLYLFYMTGIPDFLVGYEREFVSAYNSLHLDQQWALQTEYSSVLYLYLLNNDIETIQTTKFAHWVQENEPHLIEKPLFSNIIVMYENRLTTPPNYENKGLLLKWLYVYISRMFQIYIGRRLAQNPFLLFQYRATSKIPMLRPRINNILSSFASGVSNEVIINYPSYGCKVLSLIGFSRIAKTIKSDKLMRYVSTTLLSSKYEVLLNAKSISYVLYYLRYYCDNIPREKISDAARKIKECTVLRDLAPRLYWAENECVEFLKRRKEQDFLMSIFESLKKANRKLYQLALKKDEEFNLVIPDESVEILHSHAKSGSLLAITGVDYLLVPEYWNLIATTVFNVAFPNKLMSLEMASLFYSIAKCYAREQRHIDQKYCYNYIRVRSIYYELTNIMPPEFFFRDCSYYIDRPNNQYFSYKEECCEPLFRLIGQYYLELPIDVRELYENQILNKRNWVKKAFARMKIGVFSEDLKII